jgi:proteic killer suppression protein
MECSVLLTKIAKNNLLKVPRHIATKLQYWVDAVETYGIVTVRKIPGYHDEPLKGDRKGLRSIRLNKAYRAIYQEIKENEIQIIFVVEVNKHDY